MAVSRSDRLLDVYFSSRDRSRRARIGRVTIDPRDWRCLTPTASLALDIGALGAFDDAGCTTSWMVRDGANQYMYYTGWALGVSVPFYFYVGLAAVGDNGELVRLSPSPVLERSDVDAYLTASPCVMIENDIWRMWYVSGVRWTIEDGGPKHYYHIKYAESRDGRSWTRRGIVCIDFASADEYAIARPSVVRDGDTYRMWYTYRGPRYLIGYAESRDGIAWERKDADAGIAPSATGWDSEMVTYPFVFDCAGQRYMLYNGNGYGRTGFGVAVWR